ncbi:unnamed protein product, partial [Coccothraustes coccothraustes]
DGMGWDGPGRPFVPALSKHSCRRWHRRRERGSHRPTPRPRSRPCLLRAPLGGGDTRYPAAPGPSSSAGARRRCQAHELPTSPGEGTPLPLLTVPASPP